MRRPITASILSSMASRRRGSKTISERLGHHKPSFTMDRYAHVTQAHHEEVADRLEAFAPTATIGGQLIAIR